MGRCRSLTTLSLTVAIAIGAAALLAQPANAAGRSSEAWALLSRFDSPMARIQSWLTFGSGAQGQPRDEATFVTRGKDGAVIVVGGVVGGKDGAVIVVGGMANPTRTCSPATGMELDPSY